MRIQIESTTKIVELQTPTGIVPARIWEGTTESGIPVHCYVTRIAVQKDQDCTQFEREFQEHKPPTPAIQAISLRMII